MLAGAARDELAGLAGTDDESKARYRQKIAIPRRTLLDLLEEHPECDLGSRASHSAHRRTRTATSQVCPSLGVGWSGSRWMRGSVIG